MNRNWKQSWALLLAVLLTVTGGVVTAAAESPTPAAGALPQEVYVGGMPFGVKFYTDGILVVGFCDVDVTAGGGGSGSGDSFSRGVAFGFCF